MWEYYRREHGVKVSQKVMDALTYPEFEEYLKRMYHEKKVDNAMIVLKAHILGFFYKLRFKKRMKRRTEKAIVIQRWFRANWKYFSGSLKKKRLAAVKVIESHFRSYQVFMENRDFLYKLKLRRHFLFFNDLRDGLLSKSQKVIRKYWLRIRDKIRERREEERNAVRRSLRKFTVMIYTKA